ncbi:MAG TPA: winged helix DNA-binding domain-containing protein [Puia sp.]|nr:winged helix DNA-binding domain-containing protein [Puia sp.]
MAKLSGRETAFLRMSNQLICGSRFDDAGEMVRRMACVQAQDYSMAKWALGCRLASATDCSVEAAFQESSFLRTHVLRPTWHFVHPADIRWMLALSAPKIKALSAPYLRKLGIDQAVLRKSRKLIVRSLVETPRLTREELTAVLIRGKVAVNDGRISFLLMDAELDAIICSAGRERKKFAYQLLDNVVAAGALPGREQSIAELARRYFTSRGPATLADFAWWAGLTVAEARVGVELNEKSLEQAEANGKVYLFAAEMEERQTGERSKILAEGTFLLPAFDEYTVGYKDRSLVLDPRFAAQCNSGLSPVVVHKGQIIGTWSRAPGKGAGTKIREGKNPAVQEHGEVKIRLFRGVRPSGALRAALKKYSAFKSG